MTESLKLKAVYDGAVLQNKKRRIEQQRDVLERSGLHKEATLLQKVINSTNMKIKQCAENAKKQRLMLIREMFLCFVAADIATICADKAVDVFEKVTYGKEKSKGQDFAQLFKEQADEWNKLVQLVDCNGQNLKLSLMYSDLADDAIAAAMPKIYDVIDKYMNSERGKSLL